MSFVTLGSYWRGTFIQTPNGVRKVFTLGVPVIADTLRLYINGLYQRDGHEYTLTNFYTGQVTFVDAPYSGDDLYVEVRTRRGSVTA